MTLYDPNTGKARAGLGTASNGSPALVLFDQNGSDRAEIHVKPNGKPGIRRREQQEHRRHADAFRISAAVGLFRIEEISMDSVMMKAITIVLAAVMVIAMFGCEGQPLSTREKGTLVGGGLGAATGAIVGAATGSLGAGAAIGGLLGAGTGFLAGNEFQNREVHEKQLDAQLRAQQAELERQRREIEQLNEMAELE